MKRYSLLALFLVSFAFVSAQKLEKTNSGILLRLEIGNVELRFYGPEIVRVLKTNSEKISTRVSPVIVKATQIPKIETAESNGAYSIKTQAMRIEVLKNGDIQFFDSKGNQLLTEKKESAAIYPNVYFVGDSTSSIEQSFNVDDKEAIYGLGQLQNGKLNQRNTSVRLRQRNMKICIPYYQSSRGYALYWDNYSPTVFGNTIYDTSILSDVAECIDYYFMVGKPGDDLNAKMRDLTGQSPMLPLWAFGFIQSKEQYKKQDELVDVVKQYRNLGIPLDGIEVGGSYWGDDNSKWNSMQFDGSVFSNPAEMIKQVHTLNARMMISLWPSFGQKTSQYGTFSSIRSMLYFETWPRKSNSRVFDAYSPSAREAYWEYVKKNLFSLGMDAWWMNGSEPETYDLSPEEFIQSTHLGIFQQVCGLFPFMLNKGMYENQRATTSNKRVVMLTRSAFAGQQRYGSICTSGDVTSNWETLEKQITAGLSLSVTGLPYWSSDIGGYTCEKTYPNGVGDKSFHELYVRWMQFSVFTPMMRSHGTDTPREIYQFGKPGDWSFDAQAKAIRLRYHLLPYLYSTAWQVSSQSKTFMRALFFDYPNDPKTIDMRDEYLFGSSFLVAPVTKAQYVSTTNGTVVEQFEQIKTRSVYLPDGKWIDFWTGKTIKGGQTIEKNTPVDIIPLYIPSGSIIPWGPDVTYATENDWNELEIRVYPGENGTFTLYEDERDSYNYEKGAYSTIPFTWNESTKTLTIGKREGNFNGMLKKRTFKVVIITPGSNPADKSAVTINRKVAYKGNAVTVKL